MIVIELTPEELEYGKVVGTERHRRAILAKKKDRYGLKVEPLEKNIIGAEGEIALCKGIGHTFEPRYDTYGIVADVGQIIESRTRSRFNYNVLVRPNDPFERAYFLVRGHRRPAFEIIGFIFGYKAKWSKWLETYGDRDPAYFPPDSELTLIDDMPPTMCRQYLETMRVC